MPEKSDSLGDLMVADALNRIDSKLDKLDDRLDAQGVILTKQQVILDEHVKRTNMLEQKIADDVKTVKDALPKQLEDHLRAERIKLLKLGAKAIAALAGTGAGGYGLKHLIEHLLKIWS